MIVSALACILLAGCQQTSPSWIDPTATVPVACRAGEELMYEEFYGTWVLDRNLTVEVSGKKDICDPAGTGLTFERNGVVIFDRFSGAVAGMWRAVEPDRLVISRPEATAPDFYSVSFTDGALQLRNSETGDCVVLTRG